MATIEAPLREGGSGIHSSQDHGALDEIRRADVQAVICAPEPSPRWLTELGEAVRIGAFRVPRTRLHDVDRVRLAGWLRHAFSSGSLESEMESSLIDDVLWLADRLTELSGADHYTLRVFTEPPTTDCGFHVDTVTPGTPTVGLLRVYNGEGTTYVPADNVRSMADFYHYLRRRERLGRERSLARKHDDGAALERIERDIGLLDASPGFLLRPAEVNIAPAQAVVAFKHLDARDYWSDHPEPTAWIHCSPMSGETRLVVNLTPARPLPPSARRDRSTSAVAATHPPP